MQQYGKRKDKEIRKKSDGDKPEPTLTGGGRVKEMGP